MTQQIQQDEFQIHSLQIADIVSYLHQNGWQQIAHPNQRILVFQNGTDDIGNPIQLVLPSKNSFEDSPRLIAKAINLLAAVQEKSSQEIINSVVQARTSSLKGI
jgi:hypothetical protein